MLKCVFLASFAEPVMGKSFIKYIDPCEQEPNLYNNRPGKDCGKKYGLNDYCLQNDTKCI